MGTLNTSLGWLSSSVRAAGHEVFVFSLNARVISDYRKVLPDLVERYAPDMIGITVVCTTYTSVLGMVGHLREYFRGYIVLGGAQMSFEKERALKDSEGVDFAIIGEGEEVMVDLIEYLESGKDLQGVQSLIYRDNGIIKINPQRKWIMDLNKLPFPDYRLFGMEKVPEWYTYRISTSRGCPFRCTFCNPHTMQGKWRTRDFNLAIEESDSSVIEEVSSQLQKIRDKIKKASLDLMLDGEDDQNNAIVSINAGAGGTEAQDWSEILFRMYARWVERKGFKFNLIDFQPGDEAGIKSVTFMAEGEYAYGYLKTEKGVHRLVRISPFNANGKRHTSFASVFVYPELDNEIAIDIDEKDLRVDVFRASGAGGQHVNKTSSAVRITHMPSGIVVQCQQERSQHRNKEMAMTVLKSRLYQLEKQKQDDKLQEMHDGKEEIAWGSQIRSYVLHPYQMIKDHRINLETGNVSSVLDGAIDPFIEGVLLARKA